MYYIEQLQALYVFYIGLCKLIVADNTHIYFDTIAMFVVTLHC